VDFLANVVRVVDAVNETVGRIVMWLSLGVVLVCFATVYMRYALGTGKPWIQELYVWQHAIVFLAAAGYTLLHGGHVRVDLFYGKMSPRRRALVDIWGTVVLLWPLAIVIAYESAPMVALSWANDEVSQQPGGMPDVWFLKSMLHVFCAVIFIQGIAVVARGLLVLGGRTEYAPQGSAH
jgi:TRAP-type mannitol/chloroaromatic compound transport system permease small subunit